MTLSPFLAVFYCAHFGSRLPGGIRSSGPTPTGSCWRTCQSPPNPLARFRAVATVRCVKTPGLQRPFRSRHPCRAVACAPGIPANGRRDVSNCLEHDIYNENLWYESLHSSFFRIIAFRMVNSLRMQATRATFLTFPAVMSRV